MRIVQRGTYKGRDGVVRRFVVTFNPRRVSGLKEWCRTAIANGGTATKADGALRITFTEMT